MKTAIYIEEGITQLVLTPENDWETKIVDSIETSNPETSLLRGGFYECQGGWTRQDSAKRSLIIRTKIRTEPREQV